MLPACLSHLRCFKTKSNSSFGKSVRFESAHSAPACPDLGLAAEPADDRSAAASLYTYPGARNRRHCRCRY